MGGCPRRLRADGTHPAPGWGKPNGATPTPGDSPARGMGTDSCEQTQVEGRIGGYPAPMSKSLFAAGAYSPCKGFPQCEGRASRRMRPGVGWMVSQFSPVRRSTV